MRKSQKKSDLVSIVLMVAMALVGMTWFRKELHIPISPLIFVVLIGILVLVILLYLVTPSGGTRRRHFHSQPKLNEIDRMTGEDFEDALLYTLERKGWKLETTKKSGDFGADLIGRNPWGKKVVIQAKRWKNQVGVEAVNQVLAAKAYYQADHAMVITNQFLTRPAFELAKQTGVEVWTRKRLSEEIKNTHSQN